MSDDTLNRTGNAGAEGFEVQTSCAWHLWVAIDPSVPGGHQPLIVTKAFGEL